MTSLIAFQGAIVVTGTAQNLPNNYVLKSINLAAKSGNAAAIVVGNASTANSTTGYILAAGATVTIPLPGGNTNQIWVVGTSADVYSVAGA